MAKNEAAAAVSRPVADAVDKARKAGVPWSLILAALLQGLPVLLQLIERWLNPNQEVTP
jgi:hypothetical protein